MSKMKNCKSCGSVLPKSAKICPNCGAKQKKRPVLLIVIAVVLVLGIIGAAAGNSNAPSTSPSSSPSSSLESSAQSSNETSSTAEESEPESQAEPQELYAVTYQDYNLYENIAGDVACDVMIEIENTSDSNLYLGSPTYDFEDKDGKMLATCDTFAYGSSDPQIIAPGEKGYFYSNGATVDGEISPSDDVVFVPHLKVEKSIYKEIVEFDLSDLAISEGKFGPCTIIGRITNNTDTDEHLIWISFILYGSDGKPLGIYGTNITDLPSGDSQSFSADALPLGDRVTYEDIADYKVIAQKTRIQ